MSAAYDREQQNNTRLSELSSKVSALRGVTVDIYDNARDQHVIDNSVCLLPTLFLLLPNPTSAISSLTISPYRTHSPKSSPP
ncbi:hypothetical protein IMSHALPRED_011107 [Imshaugia aleurites]|uniref:Uncharacterized protein n=1 Tax=Imshaugia aleurites TaxID=172621 RepID=A0A8H3GA04_9LECA|nr:hypothetical protein IMSHALPRED_011107 [Imshaugia aleurites]